MALPHSLPPTIGLGLLLIAVAYLCVTLLAVLGWRVLRRRSPAWLARPPVSILKPLCGAEPDLYENLRTFCEQDYPEFELIFGVQSPADPALEAARRIVAEYPGLSIQTVIDERLHGSNRKVSNLQNMLRHARHHVWVFADSDARVTRDYLSTVTAPLQDPDVGLVTCLYRDAPSSNIWSRLAAMYVNEWFMPSVQLAWFMGRRDYVSGQTMAMRRDTMIAIGGLAPLNDQLADDYQLGMLVRRSGQSVKLSSYVPEARHDEPTLTSLIQHEVRWMRTIAVLQPTSFRFLFLTFSLPLAALGLALTASTADSAAAALLAMALRLALAAVSRTRTVGLLGDLWLVPLRDLITVWVWIRALRASRLFWRGIEYQVGNDGVMQCVVERSA